MKAVFTISILLSAIAVNAQDYCNYTEQSTINFYSGSADSPYGVIELDSGKYLIYGTSYYIGSNQFKASVVRMNKNDKIDSTFGTNGKVNNTWDSRNTCITAAVQNDGKILIGGYQAPGNGVSTFRAYVARLNANGSVDTTFGSMGSKKLDFQSGVRCSTVGINPMDNGKIQVSIIGSNPAGVGLLQLKSNGDYDSTFSNDGRAYYTTDHLWQTDYGDAEYLEDGSTLIVGKYHSGFTRVIVTKILSDGTLDSAFAVNGTFTGETSIMYSFAPIRSELGVDEDLFIAATNGTSTKNQFVFKLDSKTGTLDSLFGVNGLAASTNTDAFNIAHDIEIESVTGNVYVVGRTSPSGAKSSVWKLDSSGVELNHCGGSSMMSYNLVNDNALRVVREFSDGTLKLIVEASVDQPNDGTDQGVNYSVLKLNYAVGIPDQQEVAFKIYPNPCTDRIQIKTDDVRVDGIRILNQAGQCIKIAATSSTYVDVSTIPSGLYIVEIQSGDRVHFQKLLKK